MSLKSGKWKGFLKLLNPISLILTHYSNTIVRYFLTTSYSPLFKFDSTLSGELKFVDEIFANFVFWFCECTPQNKKRNSYWKLKFACKFFYSCFFLSILPTPSLLSFSAQSERDCLTDTYLHAGCLLLCSRQRCMCVFSNDWCCVQNILSELVVLRICNRWSHLLP